MIQLIESMNIAIYSFTQIGFLSSLQRIGYADDIKMIYFAPNHTTHGIFIMKRNIYRLMTCVENQRPFSRLSRSGSNLMIQITLFSRACATPLLDCTSRERVAISVYVAGGIATHRIDISNCITYVLSNRASFVTIILPSRIIR